jgi:cardiolipin synthase
MPEANVKFQPLQGDPSGRVGCDFDRMLSEDIFLRTTGATLIHGNRLRLLRDGRENYPAWVEAIGSARRTIHLETYIVHPDQTGRRFRDLLTQKAREGVRVRVLYDWFGSLHLGRGGMWKPLIEAGGEVRAMNPPSLNSLLGWASRDHRKLLTVDGRRAFISGLCIGDAWVGNPAKGIQPWRDTGVEIEGPAVADAEAAFASNWKVAGGSIPESEIVEREAISPAGSVALRIVSTTPETANLYRMDLMVAAAVQRTLWLTDAYFIGTTAYLQALRSAARDGVDVRLLVPHGSDIQWIANLSRTMYRSLLEAGVRVFEWNGPMIHAKTAVADGRWARVGSTNLNIASWLGNWELDVVIEDEAIGEQMAQMFLDDLKGATEVVLTGRNKVRPRRPIPRTPRLQAASGSGKSMLSGVVRVGSTLNAAVRGNRPLNLAESSSLFSISFIFGILALLAIFFPKLIAYPIAGVAGWAGLWLLVKALKLRFAQEARSPRSAVKRRDGR